MILYESKSLGQADVYRENTRMVPRLKVGDNYGH